MKVIVLVFLLPALICFALPIINAVVTARRQREADAARAARAEAKAAAKAERDAQKAAAVPPSDAQPAPICERPENVPAAMPSIQGNNAFAGQAVAFTGTLPNMPRAAAIAAVVANGGKAYETMPAGTTLLVVGDNPGMNKLDKADKWIGQVRKITPTQFEAMLKQPLTLTPDEFAAMIAAR